MKYLGIAFGISLGASVILFAVLNLAFHMDAHGAAGIAGLPFIAAHHPCEMLERTQARKNIALEPTKSIYTFDGFSISWKLMVAYGVMILFGVMQLSSLIGLGLITLLFGADASTVDPRTILAIALPINLTGSYCLGRWIGTRCSRYGIGVVLLVAVIGVSVTKIVDFAVLSPADFQAAYDQSKGFVTFLAHVFGGFWVFSLTGLIGYAVGRRSRLSKYFRYLLSVLPKDTRETLVNLAYEEAQNLAAGSVRPPARTPPPPPVKSDVPVKPAKIPAPA